MVHILFILESLKERTKEIC